MALELGVKELTLEEPNVSRAVRRMISVEKEGYKRNFWITSAIEARKVIKAVFGIRSERPFWLVDEQQLVCPIDRCVHLGNYTLCIQQGVSIKVQLTYDSNRTPVYQTVIGLCLEEDFQNFLSRLGWICLVECEGEGSGRMVFSVQDLQHGALYRGCQTLQHTHS